MSRTLAKCLTCVPKIPRLLVAVALAGNVLVGFSSDAAAQTNSWINSGIQFDFPPPGARSLALGGAFVAVADDATAAVANPAGLTILTKPEVSFEGRRWGFTSVANLRGHAFGNATNIGTDTISGLVEGRTTTHKTGPSFVSAVFPKGRFAVGLYRHELTRFRAGLVSEGAYLDPGSPGVVDRMDPFTASMKLDIINYGVSAAYRFANGLSVGAGIALSDFSIDTETNGFYLLRGANNFVTDIPAADRSRFTGLEQAFGTPSFAESNRQSRVTETGDDTGVAVNIGALFRPGSGKWSVGAAARINPKFDYGAVQTAGPIAVALSGGGVTLNQVQDQDAVTFNVPDTYSIGSAFRLTDRLLFAAQYDRVQFSQLSEDVQEVFHQSGAVEREFKEGLHFPDSNQARFGAEYALTVSPHVISLRMGTAYVSKHQYAYTQVGTVRFPRIEIFYTAGEDQWHATPGFGIAFTKFQVDGAFDISDRAKIFSVSAVYRF